MQRAVVAASVVLGGLGCGSASWQEPVPDASREPLAEAGALEAAVPDAPAPIVDVALPIDVSVAADSGVPTDGGQTPEASTLDVALPAPDSAATSDSAWPPIVPTLPAGAEMLARGSTLLTGLAMDDSNIYWFDYGATSLTIRGPSSSSVRFTAGAVLACPKSGCPAGPTILASDRLVYSPGTAPKLVTDGHHVYWQDGGRTIPGDGGGAQYVGVLRCSVAGCDNNPASITDMGASHMAMAGQNLVWEHANLSLFACNVTECAATEIALWHMGYEPDHFIRSLVTDGQAAFWTGDYSVSTCPLGGCGNSPIALASTALGLEPNGSIAVDAVNLYFAQSYHWDGRTVWPGQIYACAKTGCGDRPTVLAKDIYDSHGLAGDGVNIYWIEYGDPSAPDYQLNAAASIRRCPVTGCDQTPTTLAAGLDAPFGLLVDEAFLYWIEWTHFDSGDGTRTGRIWRAPK